MSFWVGENRETLVRMWSEGHTARMIAAEIPGATRNAVLGAVHRLKLPKRVVTTRAVRAVYVRKKGARPRSARNWKATPIVCEAVGTPSPSIWISLVDLDRVHCRFPYGEGEIVFCGAEKKNGSPYCAYHHALSYVRPIKVKRKGSPSQFMVAA